MNRIIETKINSLGSNRLLLDGKRLKRLLILVHLLVVVIVSTPSIASDSFPPMIGVGIPDSGIAEYSVSVDGKPLHVSTYKSNWTATTIIDVDGDGTRDLLVPFKNPDTFCHTIVYVPSSQALSVDITSDNLSSFTRFNLTDPLRPDALGNECENNVDLARIRVLYDINGDGKKELAVAVQREGASSWLIISGAIPVGTNVVVNEDLDHLKGLVSETPWPPGYRAMTSVGDINGDGVDEMLYDRYDRENEFRRCWIVRGVKGVLPPVINVSTMGAQGIMGSFSSPESVDCTNFVGLGDVNGDGFGDLGYRSHQPFYDGYWVIHGAPDLSLDNNFREFGYRIQVGCCGNGGVSAHDFDGDGFTDVLMDAQRALLPEALKHANAIILYGTPSGLPRMLSSLPEPGTQATYVFGSRPYPIGDFDHNGTVDLNAYFPNNTDGYFSTILFTRQGVRDPYIFTFAADGNEAIVMAREDRQFDLRSVDLDGDRIVDIGVSGAIVKGRQVEHNPNVVSPFNVFRGPDSLDIRWQAPMQAVDVDKLRVLIDDQSQNVSPDTQFLRVALDHEQLPERISVQSLDSNDDLLGERTYQLNPFDEQFDGAFADSEKTAQGRSVPAEKYQLSIERYSDSLAEIFWNETKRFVLLWRNGKVIQRTEGNSYLITDFEDTTDEYFVTIDYFETFPYEADMMTKAYGTFVRSNIVSINNPNPVAPDSRTEQTEVTTTDVLVNTDAAHNSAAHAESDALITDATKSDNSDDPINLSVTAMQSSVYEKKSGGGSTSFMPFLLFFIGVLRIKQSRLVSK